MKANLLGSPSLFLEKGVYGRNIFRPAYRYLNNH